MFKSELGVIYFIEESKKQNVVASKLIFKYLYSSNK